GEPMSVSTRNVNRRVGTCRAREAMTDTLIFSQLLNDAIEIVSALLPFNPSFDAVPEPVLARGGQWYVVRVVREGQILRAVLIRSQLLSSTRSVAEDARERPALSAADDGIVTRRIVREIPAD